ncbi:hypothetical protein [Ruegeria meonggei]|uniref:hypothetical protein n=1 Tax=Ruegeria meonggei TaxID=1446476 RepID=UPI00366AAD75
MAAISICEAPSLSLNDQKLLLERQVARVLRAAAAAHENTPGTELETMNYLAVADSISAIMVIGNAFRRL